MKRTLGIAFALASFAAAACSLLVDSSNLTGGVGDASVDTPASPAEGGSDAAAEGDARCDASFCEDFDDGTIGQRWTRGDTGKEANLSLVASDASPPNALRAVLLSPTNRKEALAYLEKDLGPGKAVSCEVKLLMKTAPHSQAQTDVLVLRTSAPGIPTYELRFGPTNLGASLRQDVFYSDAGCECPRNDFDPMALPLGRWVSVSLDTDFERATLRYDGTIVAGGFVAGFVPTGPITVWLGVEGYEGQPTDVLFDDLRCTVTP